MNPIEKMGMTRQSPETVIGQALDRQAMQALIERADGQPLAFDDCDFQEADLSRLDLRGARFTACAIAGASFQGATLADSVWRRCRGGQAVFASDDASEALFEH